MNTGYPSVDKPWLKYYREEAINAPLPPGSMYEYIYENNKGNLDDTALVYFNTKITYRTLFEEVDKAKIAFLAAGVKKGDVVSFITITTPEMIYAFYALNRIGAIASILDPRASAESLKKHIADAESDVLILLDACVEQVGAVISSLPFKKIILISVNQSMCFPLKQLYSTKMFFGRKSSAKGIQCISWRNFIEVSDSLPCTTSEPDGSMPALITYTGGTTGVPKGVVLSNQNINSVAEQYKNAASSLKRGQSWLTVSAPFIAYALIAGLHLPLSYGMKCYIELYDPEAIAQNILRKRINHVAATPVVFEKMINLPRAQNADLSFLVAPTCGADALSSQLEQRINSFFYEHGCRWKICQGYGMTELGTGVSLNVSEDCYKLGSVGVPFGNTIVSTFDTTTCKELKVGSVGEVCVQGPSVMQGYYNDQTTTDLVIRRHSDGSTWFHTGDLGYLDEDGFLYIVGRIKRMITRYDGFKVFPSVVEEALLKHTYVEQCAVVGVDDLEHRVGQLPVAFIVLSEDCDFSQNEIINQLIAHCNELLPQYTHPFRYYFRKSLPLTAASKIDYRALEKEAVNTDENRGV